MAVSSSGFRLVIWGQTLFCCATWKPQKRLPSAFASQIGSCCVILASVWGLKIIWVKNIRNIDQQHKLNKINKLQIGLESFIKWHDIFCVHQFTKELPQNLELNFYCHVAISTWCQSAKNSKYWLNIRQNILPAIAMTPFSLQYSTKSN